MPALHASPERRPSKHDFIGQVLEKASPILTWRPQKVQRIQVGAPQVPRVSEPSEASFNPVVTFSRATTRRMVSWPVVPELPRARVPALRALLTLITFSLLCGSALTLCVYMLVGENPVATRASASASRVAVAHVQGKSETDTLAPDPEPILAPQSAPARARTAARPHLGRGRAPQHAKAHPVTHAKAKAKGSAPHKAT